MLIRRFVPLRTPGFLTALFFLTLLILGAIHWLAPVPNNANEPASVDPQVYYVAPNGHDLDEGTSEHPWASLNHAAEMLQAGDTVYVRGGLYTLSQPITPKHSGTTDHPITYASAPGDHAIFDARDIAVAAPSGNPPFAHDQGAFQIEGREHIRVRELELINSHNAGFTVRNSNYVQLYNNKTNNSFSSGIALWNGHHHQVIGNRVLNANLPKLTDYERDDSQQTPHEAITLGSIDSFEVAYNEVSNSAKEGINIKETSSHGTVHHNYVHHLERQGLYVDSWFGVLEDVELYDNVVHNCKSSGFMVSGEAGDQVKNIRFHHNLLYDNWGTGILFPQWAGNRPRQGIEIYNNTVYHNGFGPPNPGDEFYWITGGLYLFSTRLSDVFIHHNIFSHNTGFQVGYSDRYLQENPEADSIDEILEQKEIAIDHNVIVGNNDPQTPVYAGWAPDDYANIYGINGTRAIASPAPFTDPYQGNFYVQSEPTRSGTGSTTHSPTLDEMATMGAFPPETEPTFWWQANFPPVLEFDSEPFSTHDS